MDYSKFIDIGSKISLAVVLMAIIYGGSTGFWVYGSQYEEMKQQRDIWKDLALKGVKVAEQFSPKMMTGPPSINPLPDDPTPQEVQAKLDRLNQ